VTADLERTTDVPVAHFAETVVPYGPLLRKIAINLVRRHQTSRASLKGRRLMAAWDNRYMQQVLTGIFHA
jgi:hypothetical protein